MSVRTFLVAQLRRPSGLFGRVVVAPLLNRANRPMNVLTERLVDPQATDRILEVGFGGGELLGRLVRHVPRGRVAGVDFSPEMTALANRRLRRFVGQQRLDLHCADVSCLPFGVGEFNKACTVNTIYFWPEPGHALKEIARVLEPGGRLVVTFNPRSTAERLRYTKSGFSLYDPEQVSELLGEAGFDSIELVQGNTRLGTFFSASGVRGR